MKSIAVMVTGLVTVGGCVESQATIASVRAPDFRGKLTEVFVISQAGIDGEVSQVEFEKELLQIGKTCGLRLGVSSVSKLELDPDVHPQRMKEFGAQHLLTLALTGGTKQDGNVVVATYDAKLYEVAAKRIMWRGDVQLQIGARILGDAGGTLAQDLLRKLNGDGVTQWCASLVKKPDDDDIRHRSGWNRAR